MFSFVWLIFSFLGKSQNNDFGAELILREETYLDYKKFERQLKQVDKKEK